MKPDTQALLDGAASEHGIPDVDAWIDSAIAAIHQQDRELEMMTEALRIASTAVESLHLECDRHRQAANEHRNAAMEADLRTRAAVRGEKQLEGKLTAITRWFEANQPDVFKRGLWDAIDTPTARTTLCWNCNTSYPIVETQCPSCRATNANRDPETAAIEVRAKAKTPNADVTGLAPVQEINK